MPCSGRRPSSRGASAVIVGLGGVGLSALLGALVARADPIVVLDTRPEKLGLALELGATAALRVDPADLPETLRSALAAGAAAGFDHAFECIGLVGTVELAVDLVRAGGTTTLVGMPPQGERATVDVYRFVDGGKRSVGSNYGSSVPAEAFPRLCSLHLEGRLPVERLISERIGLDDLDDAFAKMRAGDGARRVVVYEPP